VGRLFRCRFIRIKRDRRDLLWRYNLQRHQINIEALCAAPPEAFAHSPSHMPLSCPVASLSQRELHKDCGGGVGGEARRARAARPPKADSCTKPCDTSSATPSARPCAAS